jgi:hypothetical protein
MSFRLWYPQLDVYDAIRRMGTIVARWAAPIPSPERLQIFDFYLANPPLLHNTHMPSEVRKSFNALKIPRPEKCFVSFPSAQLLFHKMEPVQSQALSTMLGKGLLDGTAYGVGRAVPTEAGASLFRDTFAELQSAAENYVCAFLTKEFATIGVQNIDELRRSTGLRRTVR